jgi:hypothetical protein
MADIEKKLAELQAGSHQIQWLELDRKTQVRCVASERAHRCSGLACSAWLCSDVWARA